MTVAGKRVAVETKPLELLHELLLRSGNVVTKDELLDRIWPDVVVVEASLATAVYKLRIVFAGEAPAQEIIETVPGVGYRLSIPVEIEDSGEASKPSSSSLLDRSVSAKPSVGRNRPPRVRALLSIAGGLALVSAVAFALAPSETGVAATGSQSVTQREAMTALRKVDIEAIDAMLAAGWDPNTPFDADGNSALNILLNNCEWDPGHDRRKLLLMARTLIDGGNRLDHRNAWGDTPYSIAKAKRYCGPDHPVSKTIRTICYAGYQPLGDRCLASYEIAARSPAHPRASGIAVRSTL